MIGKSVVHPVCTMGGDVALGVEAERSLWSPRDDEDGGTLVLCDYLWEMMAVLKPMPLMNTVMWPEPCAGRRSSPTSDKSTTQNGCNKDEKKVGVFSTSRILGPRVSWWLLCLPQR